MKKHRVAVVGCGAMAQGMHLPNAQRNKRIELVATCDVDASVAEDCRARFGARRAETDWHKLIQDPEIDMFILATHTNLRGAFILPALEAGKPVYTEKPLAPNVEEMIEIVRTTRRTGVPVCVGHNRRSSPAIIEFKRLLEKARSGVPAIAASVDRMGERERLPEERQMQLLIRVNDDARSWKPWVFWDEEGILFAEMVHFIDLALWLNPGYPVRAFVEGSNRGNFTILLRFSDGSLATLQHTMVGNFDYPKELFEATVNNITVAMDLHFEVRQCGMSDEPMVQAFPYPGSKWAGKPSMDGYLKALESERRRAAKEHRPARRINIDKGHYQHLNRFLDHIEGRGENPCGVESAVPVNRVTLKLLESARLGLPVSINPEDWHLPVISKGEGR